MGTNDTVSFHPQTGVIYVNGSNSIGKKLAGVPLAEGAIITLGYNADTKTAFFQVPFLRCLPARCLVGCQERVPEQHLGCALLRCLRAADRLQRAPGDPLGGDEALPRVDRRQHAQDRLGLLLPRQQDRAAAARGMRCFPLTAICP